MQPVVAYILFEDGTSFDEAFEGLFLFCFEDMTIFDDPFDGLFLCFEWLWDGLFDFTFYPALEPFELLLDDPAEKGRPLDKGLSSFFDDVFKRIPLIFDEDFNVVSFDSLVSPVNSIIHSNSLAFLEN